MTLDTMTDAVPAGEVEFFTSRIADACCDAVSRTDGMWVARVPGWLDVMGGIAECTGSLTLGAATGGAVFAAVQRRHDQNVAISILDRGGNGRDAHGVWPLSWLYEGDGVLVEPLAFAQRFSESGSAWPFLASSALYVMLHGGLAAHLDGGLTVVLRSTLGGESDVGTLAAVETATMAASAAALGLKVDGPTVAHLLHHAEQHGIGGSSRISAAMCGLLSRPGSLLQVRCQPHDILGPVPLPAGVTVVGIDCGYRHPDAMRKYLDARAATFMGRAFIDRVIRTTGAARAPWNGYMARITVREYVERFRDRLPTKMKGDAFLERFGETGDPLTRVDPGKVYKIRSRTEHHIYENDRAYQFVECLSRAARLSERTPLMEAGELMYASHWSYGQRCGLGTVATDLLVGFLRKQGCPAGIYGARIAGNGARGTVVVLMGDTEEARSAVRNAMDAYQRETGYAALLLDGSSPGALVVGVRCVT